jgi:hypothetical protein
MASGPEAESSSHDEGLTDWCAGFRPATKQQFSLFARCFRTGVEFLLRRKLEKSAVAAETARVLQAAVQEIATAPPAQAINLPHLVTRTIQRLCPPARHRVESGTADETTDSLADSILAERTPLEQDILRRYYVLGESPGRDQDKSTG